MKVNYIIYLVRDSHGNEDSDVVREEGLDVHITGMQTLVGKEEIYFDDESYHLEDWCLVNGFKFRKIEREIEWEI